MSGRGTSGLLFEEPLIFKQGSTEERGFEFSSDVPIVDATKYGSLLRDGNPPLPELCETDVVRHFTKLSIMNYHKDLGLYPLGSCTMKHNPKIADKLVSLEGFSYLHPLQDSADVQGALCLAYELEQLLKEVSGMEAISLWPAAGSHGELTGMLIVRAYHRSQGKQKKYVLIPDSAHGTNPASAAICGYQVKEIKSSPDGTIDLDAVEQAMTDEVAAIMITNPNTIGVFERYFKEIAEIVHERGGLVYCDGANLNALMGYVKLGQIGADVLHFNLHKTFGTPHGGGGPGAGPIGVSKILEPFLPIPRITKEGDHYSLSENAPSSIGRVKLFWGNFAILVRAYVYLKALGGDGLKDATEKAVLNANYIKARLKSAFDLPYDAPILHECVFSDKLQQDAGVKTLDIAKRLMDFGFHPPTIYFPLIVHGAIMVEPTETESKRELDEFCDAMLKIADECRNDASTVKSAPSLPIRSRLDEAKAAKELKIACRGCEGR